MSSPAIPPPPFPLILPPFSPHIPHFLLLLLLLPPPPHFPSSLSSFLLLLFLLLFLILFHLLIIFMEREAKVHLEKVLGQLKNLTFFYLWCNLYYRARASSDESFLTFLTLPFGDLGSNKASKTPTEIFYTLCRKLWHIEKYSTLDVENCDRQTDRQSEVQKLRPGA